jgi:hypothetical protein
MTVSKNTIKDIEWCINNWATDYNVSSVAIRSLFRRLATQVHSGNKSFRESIAALKDLYEQPEYDMAE